MKPERILSIRFMMHTEKGTRLEEDSHNTFRSLHATG